MFSEGNLLFFYNYIFSDGTSAPKFFLVFKEFDNGQLLLMTLPTSNRRLPADVPDKHGCISDPAKGICSYIIHTDNSICDTGYKFDVMTYLHAEQITDASIATLTGIYGTTDYKVVGKVTAAEYNAIIACLKQSNNLKGKFKRLLS